MDFVREGYDEVLLKAMGAEVQGGMGAVGSMNEQMVALTDRMNVMLPYLQRQVRWQSAMFMEDGRQFAADVTDSSRHA